MDRIEAAKLLEPHVARFRQQPYTVLVALESAEPMRDEATGPSGQRYQLEVRVFWDSRRGGDLRVIGCIDDGAFRAFMPLTADFIMAPDGSFSGETLGG